MMKHLWLYPLVFGVMIAAVLCCMLRIGWMLYEINESRAFTGAQLVWEVKSYAQV